MTTMSKVTIGNNNSDVSDDMRTTPNKSDGGNDESDTVLCIPGTFLVKSSSSLADAVRNDTTHPAFAASTTAAASRLLVSNVSLSFWGGIDPVTGVVIDQGHPLMGQSVSNSNNNTSSNSHGAETQASDDSNSSGSSSTTTMLCLPSGRGSCTASQVLLELLLNKLAPKSIILRDADGLVTVGALVAEEIFGVSDIDIVCVGTSGFQTLLDHTTMPNINGTSSLMMYRFGGIDRSTGSVILGKTAKAVRTEMARRQASTQQDSDKQEKETVHADDGTGHFDAIPLTEEEKQRLAASQSEAERMALRVIFRYARILLQDNNDDQKTPTYIPVTRAHIDGCTYIGPGGLHFVQRLVQAGGKVVIPTTLNAVSADRRQWQALGVPKEYAQNSIALGNAYLALNCQPSFTCAPYLLSSVKDTLASPSSTSTPAASRPSGQDIVWGESNAVVYANSVIGAHTEKTADYLDICSALTGIIPRAGVYLPENRKPRIVLDATQLFTTTTSALSSPQDSSSHHVDLDVLAPVLGHLCGTLSNGQVPILIGLENTWVADAIVKEHHLKSFCAAFGTTGTSPLIHIAGITPDALDAAVVQEWIQDCRRRDGDHAIVPVAMQGLEHAFRALDRDGDSVQKIDLIALGNPHLSISECEYLVKLVQEKTKFLSNISNDQPTMAPTVATTSSSFTPTENDSITNSVKKRDDVRLVACISRELHQQAQSAGYIQVLQDFGMEFISDTCWCMLLDPPLIPPPNATAPATATLTNSGKYAHYAPGLTNRPVRFASTANCIEAAISGSYQPPQPTSPATTPLGCNQSMPSWLASRRQLPNTLKMQKRSLTSFSSARQVMFYALRVLAR